MKAILIVLLAFVLNYAGGYSVVTLSGDKVFSTQDHFPATINLSLLDTMWWTNVNTRSDIFVTDSTGQLVPSSIDADFNKLLHRGVITFDAKIDSGVNTKYRIYAYTGLAINYNNTSAFGNSNCVSRFGFGDSTGAFFDQGGNFTVGLIEAITYQQAGLSGLAGKFIKASSPKMNVNTFFPLEGVRKATISGVMRFDSSHYQIAQIYSYTLTGYKQVTIRDYNSQFQFYVTNDLTNTTVSSATWNIDASITAGQYFHFSLVYDGTTSTNATKLSWYVNGVKKTIAFTGGVPDSLPRYTTNAGTNTPPHINIGYNPASSSYYLKGTMDELRTYIDACDSNWVKTENAMFRDSTFYSVGRLVRKSTGNNKPRISLDLGL